MSWTVGQLCCIQLRRRLIAGCSLFAMVLVRVALTRLVSPSGLDSALCCSLLHEGRPPLPTISQQPSLSQSSAIRPFGFSVAFPEGVEWSWSLCLSHVYLAEIFNVLSSAGFTLAISLSIGDAFSMGDEDGVECQFIGAD